MDLHLKFFLAFVSCIFVLQFVSCESFVGGAGTASWTCVCAAHPLGGLNNSPSSNCSSSCQCLHDETSSTGAWNCTCTSEKALQEHTHTTVHDDNCFTSCNCTPGSAGTSREEKQRVTNKTVIITLLICVILTTIAFLSTVAYYFHRKDKLALQSRIHSFDKYTSWSSRSNLLSHRSSPLPLSKPKPSSQFGVLREFLRRFSLICGSGGGALPGIIVRFSYAELEQATNRFSNDNVIGVGGSSSVYRGQLSDGKVVAVKKLRPLGGAEEDYEFLSEIELLSRLNHCHVVPLLGYCSENQGRQSERLLVFEFMANGNLRDCLDLKQGKQPMDWETRVSIALGAARGLEYLHEAAAPRILHRDIKSTNILLDEKYRAKITDLGMAKCLMNDGTSCTNSPARMLGTFGYFAPEYAIVGKASLKSDVFSFGVVVLELITGRPPIQKSPSRADESLVIWATSRLRDSKLVVSELPDPLLDGEFSQEEMQIMAHLARECLQWDPESRPTMSEVVQVLSTIAPDKSWRRKLPATFVTSPPMHSSADGWPHERRASRTTPDRGTAGAVVSAEVVSELILMSSRARSSQRSDDDAVDLTEPRLETFTQADALQ